MMDQQMVWILSRYPLCYMEHDLTFSKQGHYCKVIRLKELNYQENPISDCELNFNTIGMARIHIPIIRAKLDWAFD